MLVLTGQHQFRFAKPFTFSTITLNLHCCHGCTLSFVFFLLADDRQYGRSLLQLFSKCVDYYGFLVICFYLASSHSHYLTKPCLYNVLCLFEQPFIQLS